MPKNVKRGKNTKGKFGSNKVLQIKEASEEYARIIDNLGNGQIKATIITRNGDEDECNCHIRGKIRKLKFRKDEIILLQERFLTDKDKLNNKKIKEYDVIYKYFPDQIKELERLKQIQNQREISYSDDDKMFVDEDDDEDEDQDQEEDESVVEDIREEDTSVFNNDTNNLEDDADCEVVTDKIGNIIKRIIYKYDDDDALIQIITKEYDSNGDVSNIRIKDIISTDNDNDNDNDNANTDNADADADPNADPNADNTNTSEVNSSDKVVIDSTKIKSSSSSVSNPYGEFTKSEKNFISTLNKKDQQKHIIKLNRNKKSQQHDFNINY